MSTENNSDEIPINVISENEAEINDSFDESKSSQTSIDKLSQLLDLEKQKVSEYEEKLSQLNDINITALSEDFLDIVDQFEWDGNEKEEFINEMLALSPSERKFILKEMLEKSNLDYY